MDTFHSQLQGSFGSRIVYMLHTITLLFVSKVQCGCTSLHEYVITIESQQIIGKQVLKLNNSQMDISVHSMVELNKTGLKSFLRLW